MIVVGVIVGALVIGTPLGFIIGNLWAQNDRRRFRTAAPYQVNITGGQIRTEPVAWKIGQQN